MNVNNMGNTGGVTMAEIMSVLRSSKASEVAGIAGKVIGVGLFAALLYNYASVLIEACVNHV
jgi:ABC-type Na+ efflux pump permease subunit